ncbi:HAUS augmin-like complex subunit 6 N-terminus-domain-containing protein [Blakeslea trispora]|nr:HAUS augmin-like complex subunit 6 N-terminus-domain-containing protein [Blakeslea trispora]
MSYISILLTNLKLLGFQSQEIELDQHLFTRYSINDRAFEIISHFLFSCIDPQRTTTLFESCWPIQNQASSLKYLQLAYQWLHELRYHHEFLLQVSVRKSTLQACHGQEMERLMMAFSTAALELAVKNKRQLKRQVDHHIDTITSLFHQLESDRKRIKRKEEEKPRSVQSVRQQVYQILSFRPAEIDDTLYSLPPLHSSMDVQLPTLSDITTPIELEEDDLFDDLESVASLRQERPPWRAIQDKMFDIDIYTPVR